MSNVYLTVGLAIFTALFGFLSAAFWWQVSERRRLVARVSELEVKVGLVTQAVVPISTAFQAVLIKTLTHFHTPVVDALLAKLGPPYALTDEEAEQLRLALLDRERDMGDRITDEERDAAHILPAVIKRAKADAARAMMQPPLPVAFRLVAIPISAEEGK